MIKAVIFDLDGTLVQTEKLKALSYARAAVELCPDDLYEQDVIDVFREVVGLSRREVALTLIERFSLHDAARQRMTEFGVDTPWQAYVQVRLRHYASILSNPQTLIDNQWPHNRALLEEVREQGCKVGLATMSHCEQVNRVLQILELSDRFDFVATRDDVRNGKPDPEIYFLVAGELGISHHECLVIEDSPAGVEAALNANMQVIAVSTPFTRLRLHEANILAPQWIVDDPADLMTVVRRKFHSST